MAESASVATGLDRGLSEADSTAEAIQIAKGAGLRYSMDTGKGIKRLRAGKGMRYVDPNGATIRDAATLSRIRALAIPPAWTDVWICPWENGHIQATGRDARGRKQYRYHAKWRATRDASKYERTIAFGRALSKIRHATDRDLNQPGLPGARCWRPLFGCSKRP